MNQITSQDIEKLLQTDFPNSKITVIDQRGDGYSFAISVKSSKFANLNLVKQHQLVMLSLKELLREKLHAVSIKTMPL
jgi:stress-induced morphogen